MECEVIVKLHIKFFTVRWFILVASGLNLFSLQADARLRHQPRTRLAVSQKSRIPAVQASTKISINSFKKYILATDGLSETKFLTKNADGSDKHVADVKMNFYDIKTTEERDDVINRYNTRLSSVFANNSVRPMIYLGYLKIYDDTFKGKGLGTQLFEYGLQIAKKKFPNAIYFWRALPLDGQHKKESLFKFYKNRGGIMLAEYEREALFYIDLARVPSAATRARA